jgi:signal transduction histidine kinase
VDIKLKKEDFKFNLIIAFIIFAFLIIVSVTYTALYIFSNILTKEFQERVRIYSDNITSSYEYKLNNIKHIALALGRNEIFNNDFYVNPKIVEVVFKSMLMANQSLYEISYYNKSQELLKCNKKECISGNEKLIFKNFSIFKEFFFKEDLTSKGIRLIYLVPILTKGGFIKVSAILKPSFDNSNFYIFFINKKGDIFFSNYKKSYNKSNIYDVLNYSISTKILNENGFITNDIYVKNISSNIKLVLLQNRNLINKTSKLSDKLVFVMLLISIMVAIPLGIFFSKPLYLFYKELDKRVKEEIEKNREKEQLLMHQGKLAALGEMLGNIAHQWRHPITRLSLLIQNLELAFEIGKLDNKRFYQFKENALAQINYMSDTIDDFTSFFRKDTKKVKFSLKEIIDDVLKLLEGRVRQYNINIYINVRANREIVGLKSEFSQVVLNILNNAVDVLAERSIEKKEIYIEIDKNISIEDNGGGIDEKIINKIFEPYFTTKFQSQGTGIGLYMSKVIITQHFKGEIKVTNTKKGAKFVIVLP